ncbi:S41 family peptidase [Flavobacterium caeni]|uniref:Peptidase family S41 n=1 Tax=Flavobacterium caeni TaxID=490189 RepID=A0A1G5HSD7_9FLAO|nr:S41 family peptidase [Flavobacterium caeni]SCY66210.1 Peptidase family S41 [Flavobacterium caeni]
MKNPLKILLFLVMGMLVGCEKDDHDVPQNIEVQDFVWKGLNLYYLWQADVPELSDYKFGDQQDLNAFLYGYPNPGELFQSLLYKPASQFPADQAIDRFSVIYSNYNDLEGVLSGTTRNHGADLALYYKDDSEYEIIAVVRYILPNSDAATKDIQRGDLIYGINGQQLNVDNYIGLLSQNSYTVNFADYDNANFTPNGQSLSLTKTVLSENPVLLTQVINEGAHKIGYLMYNGFYPAYETQLNDAFGQLKSQGITDLVLDLRYNGGGSIATAARLASMITGQFNGQVFAKEQWNAKVEAYYLENSPGTLVNLFSNRIENGGAIQSLNLDRVYVLTTRATASASELVINSLEPYIDVVQIGDRTIGKNVGSITLYDSPSFSKLGASPNHRYAMQPLVLKIVNKVGFGDYVNGLQPDEPIQENIQNLGALGNTNEPLLNAAIMHIVGGGRIPQNQTPSQRPVKDLRPMQQLKTEMYRDVPPGFSNIR